MSADTTSIFYKIGQATKSNVANAISGLLSGNNTFTGTNGFQGISSTSHTSSGAIQGLNVTATGELSGSTLNVSGGATISGDLTVTGTTTALSTTNLDVKDNFIRLSEGANQGAFTKDQGFYFERAQGSNAAAFIWDESEDEFVLGQVGAGSSSDHKYYRFEFPSGGANVIEIRFDETWGEYASLDGSIGTFMSGSPQSGSAASEWSIQGTILYFTMGSETSLADVITSSNNQAGVSASLISGDDNTSFPRGTLYLNTSGSGTTTTSVSSEDDTAEISAGAVKVGSLKIAAQSLGNLADFNAGLSA